MIDVLDYGFAWVGVLLAAISAVIFITRKVAQSRPIKENTASSLNRALRKPHKTIGLLLIVAGLVHGLASSQTVWSLNVGTVCWVLSILLGINWLLRKKLKKAGGWMIYHRIITVLFLLSIVWHILDVGGVRVFDLIANGKNVASVQETAEAQPQTADESPVASKETAIRTQNSKSQASAEPSVSDFQFDGVKLKDGSYTGSAQGFGPDLTVSVTVSGGKVTSVEVVSHNERNERFYAYPIQTIPEEIVKNQTLSIDTVSGATFTSAGIINAVIDALSNAIKEGQLPTPLELPQRRGH